MQRLGRLARGSNRRTLARCTAATITVVLLVGACSSSSNDKQAATTAQDSVAAAEARVTSAKSDVDHANAALTDSQQQFCNEARGYVTALDRYGKLFSDDKATVGDVKTAGADLVAPRDSVTSAAMKVTAAQSDVVKAQQALADAQAGLADAQAAASSVPTSATSPPPTPAPTTLVPAASITRVKQAEADLATTSAGITDVTPLVRATAEYNSAAFALEIAWLKLLVDGGCVTDAQQAQAVAHVIEYTVALQTDLHTAGYYSGPIDGVYGPQTVSAVKQLQTDNGLPSTGLVDQATALALDKKLASVGAQAANKSTTQTASLQTVLKLTGYWTGPIDGKWTPELTDALKQFQTALGVPPTGSVDAATLAAFEQALAKVKSSATTTTSTPTAPASSPPTSAAASTP